MAIERSEVTRFLQRDKYKYEDVRRPGEKEGGEGDSTWIDKTRSYEVAHAITATINNDFSKDEIYLIISNNKLKVCVMSLEKFLHEIKSSDHRLTREKWNSQSPIMVKALKDYLAK